MNIQATQKLLNMMKEQASLLKSEISHEVEDGRIMINEDVYREFDDGLTELEKDVSVSLVKLHEFGRLNFGNKRFGINKNNG